MLNLSQLVGLLRDLERYGDPCSLKHAVEIQIKHVSITEGIEEFPEADRWDQRRKLLENGTNLH